ncbi:Lrp/AsnC family transcriptional regulator [Actinacidiphila yeochonensis]|uniref:Lrp/AsnC family transcriptional regulator n=1 Tax=Actinacidiphila yeochonensis TaxID=89050 RepID=UPI00068A1960|nr:Lrp/AsnC family transcriptional regulator [Actinacidiphila yeochonensis]
MPVDALDARILRLLLQQPRTSVREYARILSVARGTLQVRLDRLEREGVIASVGPRVSPAALGLPVLAFVRVHVEPGRLDEAADALDGMPEVVEAFSTTGDGDLLARVVARDHAHLEDVVQRVGGAPGVLRTLSEIALRERVAPRVLPLVEELAEMLAGQRDPQCEPGAAALPGPRAAAEDAADPAEPGHAAAVHP